MKKVQMFGRKSKLSPSFIGPYEVVERVGPVACQLKLTCELDKIHDVFHVSRLRRYHTNPSHVVVVDDTEVRHDLSYEEELVKIVALEVKALGRKRIPFQSVVTKP